MLRNSALLALRRATRGLAASHHHVAVQRHAAALHKSDPDRWTERALARHFELPLDTLQALLALQALEETENNAGDAELGVPPPSMKVPTPSTVTVAACASTRARMNCCEMSGWPSRNE